MSVVCLTRCRSDNLFVALNNMLRKRDPAQVSSPPPPLVSRTNAVQLKQARGFLFYLMKGLEHLSAVQATVYAYTVTSTRTLVTHEPKTRLLFSVTQFMAYDLTRL